MALLHDGSLMAGDAYDLEGLRTLAAMCGVKLGASSDHQQIQQELFPLWGKEKPFIDNVQGIADALGLEGSIPSGQAIDALLSTGTLDEIRMRNIHAQEVPTGAVTIILTGAVANWMERRVLEAKRYIDNGLVVAGVYLIAGDRICSKDTEVSNPYVGQFHANENRYPTEAELLPIIVADILGYERQVDHNHLDQAEQIRMLIQEKKELAQGIIYGPFNANATYAALQMRRVIREVFPGFDADGSQFYFSQDGFAIAMTEEQATDTRNHQRPLTVFPALVRLVNELHLLKQ